MLPPFVPIPHEKGCYFLGQDDTKNFFCLHWPKVWGSTDEQIVHINEVVQVFHCESKERVQFSLPIDFDPLCVFFAQGFLFIGGKGGEEKILAYSLKKKKRLAVAHPKLLRKYRKSIDDFFLWKDDIYAVDNHIQPKYLLCYRGSSLA